MSTTPKERAELAQDSFSSFASETLSDVDTFINQIRGDHRTKQQDQVRVALRIIEAFAEVPEHRTDLRNKGAVETCKELVDTFKAKHDGNTPSIYLSRI